MERRYTRSSIGEMLAFTVRNKGEAKNKLKEEDLLSQIVMAYDNSNLFTRHWITACLFYVTWISDSIDCFLEI